MLERATGGDEQAIEDLFSRHRERLERLVRLRLSRRLQGLVDSSELLQEALAEAGQRLPEYVKSPERLPLFLWLRKITGMKLAEVQRRHLGEGAADNVSLHRGALPAANSISLAAHLLGTVASPSDAAIKVETRIHVQEALNNMDAMDREILALKHFERLSTDEIAQVLELSKGDVGKSYLRAIKRLRAAVSQIPGFQGL